MAANNFVFRTHEIVTRAFSCVIIFHPKSLLSESGRFYNSEWQRESSLKIRVWGTKYGPLRLTKAHKPKAGEGEGIGSLSNNLVCTKRQKDIYANRKHETTQQGCNKFLFWSEYGIWISSNIILRSYYYFSSYYSLYLMLRMSSSSMILLLFHLPLQQNHDLVMSLCM